MSLCQTLKNLRGWYFSSKVNIIIIKIFEIRILRIWLWGRRRWRWVTTTLLLQNRWNILIFAAIIDHHITTTFLLRLSWICPKSWICSGHFAWYWIRKSVKFIKFILNFLAISFQILCNLQDFIYLDNRFLLVKR